MADQPALDVEKLAQPSVNQPASGTYGEGAALTRLTDALPPMQPQPPTGPAALPTVSTDPAQPAPPQREGRPPTGAALPPGVPSPLMAPTAQPDVPGSTPLQLNQPTGVPDVTAQQRRLQILDMLANDPNVSRSTREWATLVRRVIVGG